MKNYFEKYSDEELINIVSQLDKKVYPENSIIRKITKDIFNTENPIHFLMIAVPLSKELAIRLNSVTPSSSSRTMNWLLFTAVSRRLNPSLSLRPNGTSPCCSPALPSS